FQAGRWIHHQGRAGATPALRGVALGPDPSSRIRTRAGPRHRLQTDKPEGLRIAPAGSLTFAWARLPCPAPAGARQHGPPIGRIRTDCALRPEQRFSLNSQTRAAERGPASRRPSPSGSAEGLRIAPAGSLTLAWARLPCPARLVLAGMARLLAESGPTVRSGPSRGVPSPRKPERPSAARRPGAQARADQPEGLRIAPAGQPCSVISALHPSPATR
ncbi:MAG: hypothetical protein PHI97_00360, partial [Desulfobulbus sp.]|nr:hypothetical protein [Desulfobulbus sp.]